jgi:hypothetical protein
MCANSKFYAHLKTSLENYGKINIFLNQQKLKEFIASIPALIRKY